MTALFESPTERSKHMHVLFNTIKTAWLRQHACAALELIDAIWVAHTQVENVSDVFMAQQRFTYRLSEEEHIHGCGTDMRSHLAYASIQ